MSLARIVADNFPISPTKTVLTGDGSTTVFTIAGSPGLVNPNELIVSLDGAVQEPTVDYTINGNIITFTSAPDNGAKVIVVYRNSPYILNLTTVADGSITNQKIANATLAPSQMSGNLSWYEDGSIITKAIYSNDSNFFVKTADQGSFDVVDYDEESLLKIDASTKNIGINTQNPTSKLEVTPNTGQNDILKLNGGNPWTFKHTNQGISSDLVLESQNQTGNLKILTDGYTIFSNTAGTSTLSINPNIGEINAITTAKAWIVYNTAAVTNNTAAPTTNTLNPIQGTQGGTWVSTGGGWTTDFVGLTYYINVGGNYGNIGGVGGYNFFPSQTIPNQNINFAGYHKTSIYSDIDNNKTLIASGAGDNSNYPTALSNKVYMGSYDITNESISWVESTPLKPRRVVVFALNSTEIVYSDYKDNVDTTNNTTWTKLNALGSALAWSSAVYGRNRYVAIPTGTNNVAVYSNQPFSSWASSTLPSSGNWKAVAYGKNNYVVVGDANKIAYSNDGATWATTPAALPAATAGKWRCVTYGKPSTATARFIALCSEDNKAAYSIDGVRWVLMSNLPSTQPWENVVYGNGKFLAVANNSNVSAYSSDGTTWTSVSNTLPTTSNWIVAYGNGKFVAISNYINGSNVAAYSSDATISWTQTSMISQKTWTCLTFGGGRFTAIATDGTVSYSTDGIDWVSSSQNLPSPSVGSSYSCAVALDDFDAFSSHTQTLLNSPDSRILVTGGYQWDSIQNEHKPSNLTFFGIPNYTTKTITWSEGSTLPTGQLGLFSHTVNQLDDNRLLVVGGYTYNTSVSSNVSTSNIYLGSITPNTNIITWVTATQSTTSPAAVLPSLCGHTTTLMGDGRLLIIGGRTVPVTGVTTYYNNVRVCSISTNTTSIFNNATQSGATFPQLYNHTTIRAGTNRVIVVGGLLSNGAENKKIYNLVYGGTVTAPTIQVSLLATLPSDMNASGATTELLSPTKLYIMDKNAYTLDFEGSPIGIKITGIITSGSSGTGTAMSYTSANFSFINGETATDSTLIVGTGTSTGFSYTTDGVYSKYNVLSVSKLGTGLSRITFQTPFKDQRKIVMCGSARLNSENLNNVAYTVQYDRPGNGLYNPTTNYADIVTRLGSSLVATVDDNCNTVTVAFFGE